MAGTAAAIKPSAGACAGGTRRSGGRRRGCQHACGAGAKLGGQETGTGSSEHPGAAPAGAPPARAAWGRLPSPGTMEI